MRRRVTAASFRVASRLLTIPLTLVLAICGGDQEARAQRERPLDPVAKQMSPDRLVVYKSIGDHELKLHVFEPMGLMPTARRSAFVIFHGGGWVGGNIYRCYPFADYFRRQGMVAVTVQYRLLRKGDGTTVFDAVRDARSAMRYLRRHADEFEIDPQKIAVAGCSAGGHLAAGTALFEGIDEDTDDRSISTVPNALVLYYPVIDTSPDGYGQKKIGKRWKEISPRHQVRPNLPTTIIFHGQADTVTPYAGAVAFHEQMQKFGNECELVSHKEGGHGHIVFDVELFDDALLRTRHFLKANSLLPDKTRP